MIKLYNILKEAKIVPVSLLQKSPYLFINADGFLEIDIDNFKKYILSNLEIIKNLWDNDGGDWDLDNITQEELNKAIKIFQLDFPNNIQDRIDLTTNNPAQYYLSSWDKKEEIEILKIFLNTLNDVINQLDEAKVVPVGMNKLEIPSGWSELEVDSDPEWNDPEFDHDVEVYSAPMEGWDDEHHDFVHIISTPTINYITKEPIPANQIKYYISVSYAFGNEEEEDKLYDNINSARKRAVEIMNDLKNDWKDEDIDEAKIVPAGLSNIPSSFYQRFDNIFYKNLIDYIEHYANYGFKNNKDISTFLFENNNAVITEYLKKRILQSEVEILRNGEVELVDSSNIDTLSEDELLEYLNEDKEAQRIISKLFWKYYFKYIDIQEIRKECFDYTLKEAISSSGADGINDFFKNYYPYFDTPQFNMYVFNNIVKYFEDYDTIPYPEDMLDNNFENYLSNSLLVQDIDEAKVVDEASINSKGSLQDIGNDLVLEFTPDYIKNEEDYKFFYCEKGLASDFEMRNGKKVKAVVGYSHFLDVPEDKRWIFKLSDPAGELGIDDDDDCYDAEEDVIGYIYLKSDKDIEIEYDEDELEELFYDALETPAKDEDIDEAKVVPISIAPTLLPMLTSDSTEESATIDYNNIAKNIKMFKSLIAVKLKPYSLDKDTLDRFLINYANGYIEVDHAGEAYQALHNITLQEWLDDIVASFEYMYEEDEEMKYEPDPRYDELTIDDIR